MVRSAKHASLFNVFMIIISACAAALSFLVVAFWYGFTALGRNGELFFFGVYIHAFSLSLGFYATAFAGLSFASSAIYLFFCPIEKLPFKELGIPDYSTSQHLVYVAADDQEATPSTTPASAII